MIVCPNITLPEWKKLKQDVGENMAYFLWNKFDGDVNSIYKFTNETAIPLPGNEKLYKKYNLLTKAGKIKTLPVEEGRKWAHSNTANSTFRFIYKEGNKKMFIFPPLLTPYKAEADSAPKLGVQGSLFSLKESEGEVSKELETRLVSLLSKLGISITNLEAYKALYDLKHSSPGNMMGVADMLNKVIAYDNVKELPQEAAHMLFQLMIDQPFAQRLLQIVESTDLYKKNLELYGDAYNNDIELIKKETVGQLIGEELIKQSNPNINSRIKSLIHKFWNKIKALLGSHKAEVKTLTEDISKLIFNEDMSVFNQSNLNVDETLYSLHDLIDEEALKKMGALSVALDKRIQAAKSKLSKHQGEQTKETIIKLIELKEKLEEQLAKNEYEKAIVMFYDNVNKETNAALKFVKKLEKGKEIITSEMLYNIKGFLDYYKPVIQDLGPLISSAGKLIVKDKKGRKAIVKNLNSLNSKFRTIEKTYNLAAKEQSRSFLKKMLDAHPDLNAKFGDKINDIVDWVKKDVWSITRMVGSLNNVSDVLLQSLHYHTSLAKQRVHNGMIDVGKVLLKVLDEENFTDFKPLFETDAAGNNTGNIHRQDVEGNFINYGQYTKNSRESFAKYRSDNKVPAEDSEEYFALEEAGSPLIKKYEAHKDFWYKKNREKVPTWQTITDSNKANMSTAEFEIWYKENYKEYISEKDGSTEYYPTNTLTRPKLSIYRNDTSLTASQERVRQALLATRATSIAELPLHRQKRGHSYEAMLHRLPMQNKELNQASSIKDVTSWIAEQFSARIDDDLYGEKTQFTDGSSIKVVPIYYTKDIEDLNNINTNLASSYMQFYKVAKNYSEMTEVLYEADVIVNQNKKRTFQKTKTSVEGSELDKMLESFVNIQILGEMAAETKISVFGKEVSVDKISDRLNSFVRLNNLVLNIPAIFASAVNTEAQKIIENLVGQYTTTQSSIWADKEMMVNLPDITKSVGKVLQTNKVQLLLETVGVVSSADEMFSVLDKSRAKRLGLKNNAFTLWGMTDYLTKGRLTLSMYNNLRLINGKWLTKYQFDKTDSKLKWEEQATLYDQMEVKDGKLTHNVDQGFVDILNLRIKELASEMDLQLTPDQKGAIYQNAAGRLIMTHRSWFIKGLAKKLKPQAANFYKGTMDEGQYRTVFRVGTDVFGQLLTSKKKLQYLQNLWGRFDSLTPLEQINLKKSTYEAVYMTAVLVAAIGLTSLKNGDDDEVYALELASYLTNRTLIEATAFHNPVEGMSLVFNSPIAGARQLSQVLDIGGFLDGHIMESGPYEDYSRRQKKVMELIPGLKSYMGLKDPKGKNKFLINKPLSLFPGLGPDKTE